MSNNNNHSDKNLYWLLIKFISSSILGTLMVSIYILFDTIFIGQGVGSDGLAALNICLPIYSLLSAIGLLLGMGGGATFSILSGQSDKMGSYKVFSTCIYTGFIISILFIIVGITLVEPLALLLGSPLAILPLVKDYMRLLLLFSPSFLLVNILTVFIRNDNRPHIAMFATITSGILNILLDILFIFPLHMGMKGAALATGISSSVSVILLFIATFHKTSTLKYVKLCKNDWIIARIVKNGIPSFITEICTGLTLFLFNTVLLKYIGAIGVSAYGIIANIALMVISIFNGIGQGIQPLISTYTATGEKILVKKITRIGIFLSLSLGILFYILGVVFRVPIASMFVSDDYELIALASFAMPYYFIAFIFMGINLTCSYLYQAAERAFISSIISLGRGLIFITIGLIILPIIFNTVGIWLAMPFAEIATMLFICSYYIYCNHIPILDKKKYPKES